MVIIEAPAFTRHRQEYLDEDEYRLLQLALVRTPSAGDVIQDSGGFRKIRWPDPRRGKGKRGGLRVIYFHFEQDRQLWLMTIYDKNEKDDLSAAQRRLLRQLLEVELEERTAALSRRSRKG